MSSIVERQDPVVLGEACPDCGYFECECATVALDQAAELQAELERSAGRRALAELLATLRGNAAPLDCQACRRMVLAVNWALSELEV